jgi:low temperature requirement protein LtrA
MTKMRIVRWWGAPKNFNERKNERKIGWLELFYDLVYVAAIAQITHHLASHLSWSVAGFSFLLFSLVFWSWVNGSQYYDLHGNEGIRTRLMTFWQMLGVAAAAISISDAYDGHHQGFAISFSMLQIMITYLWWSVGLYDPSHRVFNKYYTFNYIIAFCLLFISVFTDFNVAIILWIIVLILDLTPSLIGAGTIIRVLKERGQVFSASEAIVERFGLFTIIVLAESILGTVTGIAEIKDKQPAVWIAFMLSILIAFLLWSLYFDMTSEQETKKGYSYLQWLIFLHFPFLASFCVIGAGFNVLLSDMTSVIPVNICWMFCICMSTILFTITGLTKIMEEYEEDRSYIQPVSQVLIIMGLIILAIPFFATYLTTLTFLSVISFILFVPVIIGIRSWVRYKYYSGPKV